MDSLKIDYNFIKDDDTKHFIDDIIHKFKNCLDNNEILKDIMIDGEEIGRSQYNIILNKCMQSVIFKVYPKWINMTQQKRKNMYSFALHIYQDSFGNKNAKVYQRLIG